MMRLIVFVLSTLCAITAHTLADPLDPLLSNQDLWKQTASSFMPLVNNLGFTWTSTAHDSARCAHNSPTIFGLPVEEAVAHFKGGTLKEVTFLLSSRADASTQQEETFDSFARTAIDATNKAAKTPCITRDPTFKLVGSLGAFMWETTTINYSVTYCKTRADKNRGVIFSGDYVRLQISPPENPKEKLPPLSVDHLSRFIASEHVKKEATSGDVWLAEIPMVIQQKTTIAIVAFASVERIMRYYGFSVDKNELESAVALRTRYPFGNLSEDVKDIVTRFKVRVRGIVDYENDVRAYQDLLNEYNQLAKARGAAPISTPAQTVDWTSLFTSCNAEILKETRTKNKAKIHQFEHDVQSNIDRGSPLLWEVTRGVVLERGISQMKFLDFHARLIIGYNPKTHEILYSDAQGSGYESERMPLDDAWTQTFQVFLIEPL